MAETASDDLAREVYCLQGVPIDAVTMSAAVSCVLAAAENLQKPFLLSTPNLNIMVSSQSDPTVRESLRASDLCVADGIAVIWLARLLRLPITGRVAGSDLFELLVTRGRSGEPLKAFLFGGNEGAAAAACESINKRRGGVRCVGWLNPGFGSIADMSKPAIIDAVNRSGADFLLVALGAKKGQAWLHKNGRLLTIPVRSHLGATINFQGGSVRRAPRLIRRIGMEWLWRIKEEPRLWRRYAEDGGALVRLTMTRMLPLLAVGLSSRLRGATFSPLRVREFPSEDSSAVISISGSAQARDVAFLGSVFQNVLSRSRAIELNLSGLYHADARVLGLLLMVRKKLLAEDGSLRIVAASRTAKLLFRFNGLGDLL